MAEYSAIVQGYVSSNSIRVDSHLNCSSISITVTQWQPSSAEIVVSVGRQHLDALIAALQGARRIMGD